MSNEPTTNKYHAQVQRLRILHRILSSLISEKTVLEIAKTVLRHVRSFIPFSMATIVEYDAATAQYRALICMKESDCIPMGPQQFILSMPEVMHAAFTKGLPYEVRDVYAVPKPTFMEKLFRTMGIGSYLYVPLMAEETLTGTLNVAAAATDFFTDEHKDFCSEISGSLALAMQRIRDMEHLRKEAQTNEILLKEMNHRIGNNLAILHGMVKMELARAIEQRYDCRMILEDLSNRILGIGQLHHMLSLTDWAPVSVADLAKRIINTTVGVFESGGNASIRVSDTNVTVHTRYAYKLAIIFNELATNTVKYATKSGKRIGIEVSIRCDCQGEDSYISIEYKDSGPGYPKHVIRDEQYNTGLMLIRTFVCSDLKGELCFENSDGAIARIRFRIE